MFVRFGFPETRKLRNHRFALQVESRNQTTPSYVRCEDYSVDLYVWCARDHELDCVSALSIYSPCSSGNDPIWDAHRTLQGAYLHRIENKFSYHLLVSEDPENIILNRFFQVVVKVAYRVIGFHIVAQVGSLA